MLNWLKRWLDRPFEYVTLPDRSRVMVNGRDLRNTFRRNDPGYRAWQCKMRAGDFEGAGDHQ